MPKNRGSSERSLCPAPGCGELVTRAAFIDARERLWHRTCALRTLSDHFRTPVDLEATDGESVRITAPGEFAHVVTTASYTRAVIRAPYDFDLLAVRIVGDRPLRTAHIGSDYVFSMPPLPQNALHGGDFEDGRIPLGKRVLTGLDLTFEFAGRQDAVLCELIGVKRPRRSPLPETTSIACYAVQDDGDLRVRPEETAEFRVSPVMPTLFERIVADDWHDWQVARVMITAFAGNAAGEANCANGVPLEGRVTALPTFAVGPGEFLRVVIRNTGDTARPFCGRLYGRGLPNWRSRRAEAE